MNDKINQMDEGLKKMAGSVDVLTINFDNLIASVEQFYTTGELAAQSCSRIAEAMEKVTQAGSAFEAINIMQVQLNEVTQANIGVMTEFQEKITETQTGLSDTNLTLTEYLNALADLTGIVASVITIHEVFKDIKLKNILADKASVTVTQIKVAAERTAAIATRALAGAQRILNAVMKANPIGLVVTAIGTLVTAFIVAYNKCDSFKQIVDNAWSGVKNLASAIWDSLVKAFEKVSSVLSPIWNKLKALLGIQEQVVESNKGLAITSQVVASAQTDALTGTELFSAALKNQNSELDNNLGMLQDFGQQMSDLDQIKIEPVVVEFPQEVSDILDTSVKPVEIPVNFNVDNSIEDVTKETSDALQKTFSNKGFFESYNEGINGISSTMQSLSKVVGESAGAWLTWGANLIKVITEAIPQIIALATTQISASNAQSSSSASQAATGAAAAVSSIPIVGPILAIAAIASVLAAIATIPKPKAMAMGGIAFGPTLALVGEYAGASGNPEVIAPLNKLRSLIEPRDSYGGGQVEFKISGRELVGVMQKMNQVNQRTR